MAKGKRSPVSRSNWGKTRMRSKLPCLMASALTILLVTISVPTTAGLTLAPPQNRSGLPYPEQGYRGDVYLKEASITLDINSSWSGIPGYGSLLSVAVSHKARYIFENTGGPTVIPVKIPVAANGKDLAFKLDGLNKNYTDVEFVKEIEPDSGAPVYFRIYTFTVPFLAQTRRAIEVDAEQFGTASGCRYFYLMKNASRWMKPIEDWEVVLTLREGRFRTATIDPTTRRADGAAWEVSNLTPSSDLVFYWQIQSEPSQPLDLTLTAIVITAIAATLILSLGLRKRWNRRLASINIGHFLRIFALSGVNLRAHKPQVQKCRIMAWKIILQR